MRFLPSLKEKNYYFFCGFLLCSIILYYFSTLSIIAGDTDLWYHLNGGRYILENKSLPKDSYFSFISPPRQWIDYYWLFQVVVYKIYSFSGYYGVIALRAITYITTILLIFFFLSRTDRNVKTPSYLYLAIIFALYSLMLIPRYTLVRPHIFSYLFIAAFVYILEFKPKKGLIILPLLALFWTNLHGVEYPVMILICLAYVTEAFIERIKNKRPFSREELFFVVPAVIAMSMIFLTPHGMKLIKVPFVSIKYATQYILEHRSLRLEELTSFNMIKLAPSYLSVFNILLVMASLAMLISIFRKKIRIGHLLMFAGGVFLLTKALRFTNEFVLLALPLLGANAFTARDGSDRKALIPVYVLSIAALIIIPIMFISSIFPARTRYPISYKNLPAGVAAFLNHIEVGGRVLNYPNTGGYLQWMLYPRYKISMDMEVPFLFTDEDFYYIVNAFYCKEVLGKFLAEYNPSFISVPIKNMGFREIIKEYPEYVLVFFDDAEVLYVNKKIHPLIAEKYALKTIDPFILVGTNIKQLTEKERINYKKELLRIAQIYPDGVITNQILAMIHNIEGNPEGAIPYVNTIIAESPENPKGYRLKGDIMLLKEKYDEAIRFYKMALKRAGEGEKSEIYKKLWLCYSKLDQSKEAYRSLTKAVDMFSVHTSYTDLYNLGLLSLAEGKTDDALLLFKFARLKVPPDNSEWINKIEKQLSKFKVDDKKEE